MPSPRPSASLLPAGSWQSGWEMRASVWSGCENREGETPLRTLANPGDIAPVESPPPWSFHLGPGALFGTPVARLLANGFLISFPQADPDAHVDMLLVAPNTMVGRASIRINPSLFCPEAEPVEEPGCISVEVTGCAVVLRIVAEEETTRFCLATSREGLDAARTAAEQGLALNLSERVEKELDLRKTFWSQHRRVGQEQGVLQTSFERLVFRLEPPTAKIPGWWVRDDEGRFPLRSLYALVRAWREADEKVAVRLVRTVLASLPASGALPAELHPDSGAQTGHTTWPLLVSCVWSLRKASGASKLVEEALPALRGYLQWALDYFDPQGQGAPAWKKAEESPTPETFDADLFSAGLAGMLLRETDLFFELLDQHPDLALDTAEISLARERIEDHLLSELWDEEAGIFRDRYRSGKTVTRITVSGVLPLLWPGLEAKARAALLRHLQEKGTLHRRTGWAAWQAWEDDPTPAPVRCDHQLLLLDRVREVSLPTAVQIGVRVAETLEHCLSEGRPFPAQLNQTSPDDDTASPPHAEIDGACLYLLCKSPLLLKHPQSVSKVATRLDENRNLLAVACLGALLLLMGVLALREWRGGAMDSEAAAAAFGLTEQLINSRQFDQALKGLQEMEGRVSQKSLDFYTGMIRFHQGDFAAAEHHFRAAADADGREAEAMMNLALSVFRQGKLDDALNLYEQIIQQFDQRNPQFAQMARAAMNVIRENEATFQQSLGFGQ